MKFKTIEYRFERNSLHEVGRVPSEFTVAKVIDHTAGVAAKQEPAVAGEFQHWERQNKKTRTEFVSFCFGSECWGTRLKTI